MNQRTKPHPAISPSIVFISTREKIADMSADYYSRRLAGERLLRCYETAPRRVRQYLAAEIDHVLAVVERGDRVLELGCGYGRVMQRLAPNVRSIIGIDTAVESLALAQRRLADMTNCRLLQMNAVKLAFRDDAFDIAICLQNGISAIKEDSRALLTEADRVTRPGGKVLFSSYATKFWEARLNWFRRQAAEGLIGPIDERATGDGVIVCRDGFRATTCSPEQFREWASGLGKGCTIVEVDESSVFCEIEV